MIIVKSLFLLLFSLERGISDDSDWHTSDCGTIEEIPGDIRTKVPWVAAIFVQTSASSPYKYFVTGTITDPYTIVTVLGGAYGRLTADGRKYSVPAPEHHKVAVGLSSSDLDDRDKHTQIVEVSNTIPYTKHEPENNKYHVILFQLKIPLNLTTPYARALCVAASNTFTEQESDDVWAGFVVAGGFVGPNNELRARRKDLKSVDLLVDSNRVCEREFTRRYDHSGVNYTYCARLALGPGQEPVCPSYGTAAVSLSFGRLYLIGILALHQGGESWCGPKTILFFSRVVNFWDWIWELQGTPGGRFACGIDNYITMDQVCDQKSDCEDARDEDPVYCRGRNPCITPRRGLECGVYGPCLNDDLACDGRKDCPNGEDESPKNCPADVEDGFREKATRARCPPLEDISGTRLICKDKYGDRVSCKNKLPQGSKAFYSCQEYYESTDPSLPVVIRTCLGSGAWEPLVNFKCTPECGIIGATNTVPFIVKGQVTSRANTFPWHASIFRVENEGLKYICGGSLLEKNIVVTAGHCVADSPGEPQTQVLRVILGTNTSDYTAVFLTSSTTQIFQVTKARVPLTYDPLTLLGDIALLQLNDDAVLNPYVRPVCYFTRGTVKNLPIPGTLGKSSRPRAPPISTFCAGYKNGSSVCQGDSGGGLVFPETINGATRYVLKGLVSHGDLITGKACNVFNYAVFTHVDAYADWILRTLQSTGRIQSKPTVSTSNPTSLLFL